jgi:translation initiation factor 2 subunit 1
MSTIARRLTPQPIKLRADIELTCYTPAGIDAIKKALRAGEKESSEAVPIKAKLVAPPLYVLSTNATDKVRPRVISLSQSPAYRYLKKQNSSLPSTV